MSALALAAAVSGCSGSSGAAGPTHAVRLSADPTGALSFGTSRITTTAGEVRLLMSDPSPIAHGIAVVGEGVTAIGPVVGQGATSALAVRLKPGTYTFYCPVPGHRQAGMTGTLTVR